MKKLLPLVILTALITLTGCSQKEIVIPEIADRPQAQHYNIKYINISNDVKGYFLTDDDALKMSQNWINYKAWAELNYKILLELKESVK